MPAGGDDVTQLCEAGEDEFLEIMALVGMAAKPLHVRRLQKALQEWVTSPGTCCARCSLLILQFHTCSTWCVSLVVLVALYFAVL